MRPQQFVSEDTIVAIATAPGRGGIGIVRLSGADALRIATALVQLKTPLEPRVARFTEVRDPETASRLDEAVVTWFAGPHSYTGEDVVEIAAHGAPVILDHLLRQAVAQGARLARPGEFTERAFLSGRLDLTQAEAVRDLIEAQTLYQARIAAEQLDGALSRRVAPVKAALVELIALLEAGIDFAEDDIDVAPDRELHDRIAAIRTPLEAMASSFSFGRIVRAGMTLAIVGRPNAGKSSLFNRLIDRDRAIVTATPGTTRDLVTERVSLGGIPLTLVDTAGLRHTTEEAESIGIRKSREAMAEADLVLLVLDATQEVSDEEQQLSATLAGRHSIVVRNKIDLVPPLDESGRGSANESENKPRSYAENDARNTFRAGAEISTSAVTGEGIATLQEHLLRIIRQGSADSEHGMLTNVRQQQAVLETLHSLAAASTALEMQTPHEMVLLDLYGALRPLDSLTGDTTPDDVLNLIFSSFCIGK